MLPRRRPRSEAPATLSLCTGRNAASGEIAIRVPSARAWRSFRDSVAAPPFSSVWCPPAYWAPKSRLVYFELARLAAQYFFIRTLTAFRAAADILDLGLRPVVPLDCSLAARAWRHVRARRAGSCARLGAGTIQSSWPSLPGVPQDGARRPFLASSITCDECFATESRLFERPL